MSTPQLSILVPVKNDGINLKIMIKVLSATVECSYEVIVIYDFDEDDAVPILKTLEARYSNVKGIKNKYGVGISDALHTGIETARGEYVLIFAADEVGPVIAIEDMLELMKQGCDLVSCTRYAYGGRRLGGSFIGGVLSRLANGLFRTFISAGLSDCTTGIKMLRKGVFESLNLSHGIRTWAIAFELGIKAQFAGLQLGEVPIVSIDRLYGGKSTFKVGASTKNYLYWFAWAIRRSLKRDARNMPKTIVRSSTYFNKKSEIPRNEKDEALSYGRDRIYRERISS